MMSLRIIYVEFLILLFNFFLIFIASFKSFNTDGSKISLDKQGFSNVYLLNDHLSNNDVLPERYNLDLTFDPSYDKVIGSNTIVIIVASSTKNISLHAYKLTILEDGIKLRNAHIFEESYTVVDYHYHIESEILNLWFNKMIDPGRYNLIIRFATSFSDRKGIVQYQYNTNLTQERLIITQIEPNGARRVFPCWDEPRFQAIFNINVVHPKIYRAFSNMPIAARNDGYKPDTYHTHFINTLSISASHVLIALLRVGTQNATFIETHTLWRRAEVDESNTILTTEVLKDALIKWDLLDILKLIPETHYILSSNITSKPIGCQGLILYREKDLLYDKNYDFPGQKLRIMELIRYTSARVSFMDLISMTGWIDLWLSESLAHYYSYHISSIFSKNENISIFNTVRSLQLTLKYNVDYRMKGILSYDVQQDDEIEDELLSPFYYVKGYLLLRMLGDVLLPTTFYDAVLKNLTTFHFYSRTANDVWNTLQQAYNVKEYENIAIKKVINTWLTEKSYPIVKVEHNFPDSATISIVSENVNRSIAWKIPISYVRMSELISKRNVTNVIWLNHYQTYTIWTRSDVLVDFVTILRKMQNAGYYRVNYDNATWMYIADYLNNYDYNYFDVFTRAQFIDDAYYFMMKGYLPSTTFWHIAEYLTNNTDYIAWYPMFNVLENIGHYWNYPGISHIKTFVLLSLNGVLKKVGYEEDINDDEMRKALRLLATRWACKLGHAECRFVANEKFISHLDKPDKYKISPWWIEWTYCAGMMATNKSTLQFLFTKYEAVKNPIILKHMYCLENEKSIIEYLESLIIYMDTWNQEDLSINKEFIIKLFFAVVKKHITKNDVLLHILDKYSFIRHKLYQQNIDQDVLGAIIMNMVKFKDFKFTYLTVFADLKNLFDINMSVINFIISAQKERIKRYSDTYQYL